MKVNRENIAIFHNKAIFFTGESSNTSNDINVFIIK